MRTTIKSNQTTPAFCDYCSTIEGESVLSKELTLDHIPTTHSAHSAPSHWCCDERPCSGTVPYMGGIALIQPLQDTTYISLG